MTSVTTTISWVWVHSSGATRHYDRVSSEDSHLLTLDYSEIGPVELSVTFSSHLCNKTTVITYLGKTVYSCLEVCVCPTLSLSTVEGVLTSVYLRSRTLVIESKDCISSPQNYRIQISSFDSPTLLVVLPFNTTVEYDLGDIMSLKYIRVELVDTSSSTTIDEMDATILHVYDTVTPSLPGLYVHIQPLFIQCLLVV